MSLLEFSKACFLVLRQSQFLIGRLESGVSRWSICSSEVPLHVQNSTSVHEAALKFSGGRKLISVESLHQGHIHETFISTWNSDGETSRMLHQRMNSQVFQDIPGLMHNIKRVTEQLRLDTWRARDYQLEVLEVIATNDGEAWATLPDGAWRTFTFVDGTDTFDHCQGSEQAYGAAVAFGNFQARLFDLDARELVETIPSFFSSTHRLRQFQAALRADVKDRASSVRSEIEFVLAHAYLLELVETGQAQGRIPVRVIHGDTKLNNVLFDKTTGAARCIVDLDTCMPGWSLYDFGDLVRFAVSVSAEDETDLTRVGLDQDIYRAIEAGWMDSAGAFMNADELELMPLAAAIVTLTVGLRFLTDHLAGDEYFKIQRENQNLDRARVQFEMVRIMERNATVVAPVTSS